MGTSRAAPSGALRWLHRLDQILRNITGLEVDEASRPSLRELLLTAAGCAAFYGAVMGLYAVSMRGVEGLQQVASSLFKVPLLLALTVVITFPSFYVLSMVRGVRLVASELFRLQLVGLSVLASLLASLGPIVVFFTMSTDSHGFLLLLNTAFFLVASFLGMKAVWSRGVSVVEDVRVEPVGVGARRGPAEAPTSWERVDEEGLEQGEQQEEGGEERPPSTPAPPLPPRAARAGFETGQGLLRAWFVIAFVVAAQSAWILRPLIGRPNEPFVWFTERESNALSGFVQLLTESLR
ncbi:MAG: hypothetical protein AAF196_07545 [Planctomycetota bacterium]